MKKRVALFSLLKNIKRLLIGVKFRAFASFIIHVFQGITEGVGLLFILPLLSIIGISDLKNSDSRLSSSIKELFESFGIVLDLNTVLCIYLLIISFYASLKYLQSINTAVINQAIVVKWRFKIFKVITEASWQTLQHYKTGMLQEVLLLEVRKFGSMTNQFVQLIGHCVLVMVYLFVSLLLSIELTLLSVLPLILLLIINKPLNKRTHDVGKSSITHHQQMSALIEEHLSALKLIKSYNKEKEQLKQFKAVSNSAEVQNLHYTKTTNRTKILFEIVAAIIVVVYVYVALIRLAFPIEELMLLILIFARLLPKVGKLLSNYQSLLNLIPAFKMVSGLIGEMEGKDSEKQSSEEEIILNDNIVFEKVSFSHGGNEVLNDLSFEIPYQKTTVILGASGTGKTTIVELLLGLREVCSGSIKIGNSTLKETNSILWRKQIGFVPQEPFLFNESILENLKWVNSKATTDEINLALKRAGALDFVNKLPKQLDTLVGNKGTMLSGGERQRIAFARALLMQPALLILDEATNAIDNENEQIIKQALQKLNGKVTIVIVAHRSSLVDLADNIVKL